MNKSKRPLSVTLLALGVLIISIVNLVRFEQALEKWKFLTKLQPISPLYQVVSGLVWAIFGLIVLWGLWRGLRWARFFCGLLALSYLAYYWIERLLLENLSARGYNLLFTMVASLILLMLVFGIIMAGKVRAFFGESHVYER